MGESIFAANRMAHRPTRKGSESVSAKSSSRGARIALCGPQDVPLAMPRDHKPLRGKRIVVTRAPAQAQELIHALESLGAEVLLLPTVSFAPPEDLRELDRALERLQEFDWILFTSQNAVRFFCRRSRELDQSGSKLQLPRPLVAAVGSATAQAATGEGIRVHYVAQNQSGESLAQELWGSIGDRTILLPRSDRADDRLPRALREAGAHVTEVVAYRTVAPEAFDPALLASICCSEVDAIVFASPSGFENLANCIGREELANISARVQLAAIGPTTARSMRQAGVRVEIEATEASAVGLSDSIAKYYLRQPSGVKHP
jgi:uroporphyrinogen III methyltransferase / synthase